MRLKHCPAGSGLAFNTLTPVFLLSIINNVGTMSMLHCVMLSGGFLC